MRDQATKLGAWGVATGVALASLAIAAPAGATEYRVGLSDDREPDGCAVGGCTLREATIAANDNPGRDVVVLRSGRTHRLELGGSQEDEGQTGDLDVTDELDIVATGRRRALIDAGGIDRALDLHAPAKLEGVRITGGYAGASDDGLGAAIRATGRLTLRDSAIVSNFGPQSAIALLGEAGMTARGSEITGNLGSGILAAGGGVRLAHSEVEENGAYGVLGFGEGSIGLYHAVLSSNGLAGAHEVGDGDLALVDVEAIGNGAQAGFEADDGGLYVRRSQLRANGAAAIDESGAGVIHAFRARLGSNRGGAVVERGPGGVQLTKSKAAANDGVAVRELDDGVLGMRETQVLASALGGVVEEGPGNAELTIAEVRDAGGDGVREGGDGTAILNRTIVSDNASSGLVTDGDARVYRTRITGNRAGIEAAAGVVSLARSTVARNRSEGGIVALDTQLELRQSTIAGNAATVDGGGVLVGGEGEFSAINSTIAQNSAGGRGGGIFVGAQASATLDAVTLARNSADEGGGLLAEPGAQVLVENSLLGANTAVAGADCFGELASDAGNLVGDTGDCSGLDEVGDRIAAPGIGRLAPHGGPTATISLRRGSAAIGAAGPDAPPRDQRNVRRADPDAGAFER